MTNSRYIIVGILLVVLLTFYLVFFFTKDDGNPHKEILDKILNYQNETISAEKISKCTYDRNEVYYVESQCCDRYNYLFDSEGNLLCYPDGGITGRGDGKCPDFNQTSCINVWNKD